MTSASRARLLFDLEVIASSLVGTAAAPRAVGTARNSAEQQCEVGRARRVLDRLLVRDETLFDESRQALIERRHAKGVEALRDRVFDLAGAHRIFDHLAHAL